MKREAIEQREAILQEVYEKVMRVASDADLEPHQAISHAVDAGFVAGMKERGNAKGSKDAAIEAIKNLNTHNGTGVSYDAQVQIIENVYLAGAASVSRKDIVDDFQARLAGRFTAMADKQWTFEIDSRAEAKQMLRAAIALEMDAVIAEMEKNDGK